MSKLLEMPFDLYGKLIFIKVESEGLEPCWFVVDTGAYVSVIDSMLAQEFGLEFRNVYLNRSDAEPLTHAVWTNVSRLNIPGLNINCPWIEAKPLRQIDQYYGRRVDGLLGGDVFYRHVIELDYESRTICFYDPEDYEYGGHGEAIEIEVSHMWMTLYEETNDWRKTRCFIDTCKSYVEAQIILPGLGSSKGKFLIDTAFPTAVVLSKRFTDENEFLDAAGKVIPSIQPAEWGDGETLIGRVEAIQIGSSRFRIGFPITSFLQITEGELSRGDLQGIIGSEVLRRFKVIFDYPNNRMFLEPNSYLAEADEYDMSGIFLIAHDEGFQVFKLIGDPKDSPAVEAGLNEGDIITDINGEPFTGFTLEQVWNMFAEEDKKYGLEIKRDGKTFQTHLKTRKLI